MFNYKKVKELERELLRANCSVDRRVNQINDLHDLLRRFIAVEHIKPDYYLMPQDIERTFTQHVVKLEDAAKADAELEKLKHQLAQISMETLNEARITCTAVSTSERDSFRQGSEPVHRATHRRRRR